MIDSTEEELVFPLPLACAAICPSKNDKENHDDNNNNSNPFRRPLKCSSLATRNKQANKMAELRQHTSQIQLIVNRERGRGREGEGEIEIKAENRRDIIGENGGKLGKFGQDLHLDCLKSSQVPNIDLGEDGNPDTRSNNHLMFKSKSENRQQFEIAPITTKLSKTFNKSHKSESKHEFHRTRQKNMTANCRKKYAFFSKQKQKLKNNFQHHHHTGIGQQATSIHMMIIKLILLLFLLLATTTFYSSLGSDDHISSQKSRINDGLRQTLPAQATESSTSKTSIGSISNYNNRIDNSILNHSNLLNQATQRETSTFVYNESPENLALIKRQAEGDDINQASLISSSTGQLQAEARGNTGADDSNNNDENSNNKHDDDETNYSSSSDSDKSSQIPAEQMAAVTSATTTSTSTSTTTKKPSNSIWSSAFSSSSSSTKRSVPVFRVTENELLPFSEFVVQQPAFSDLMKSWPPTTQQSASSNSHNSHYSSSSSSSSPYSRLSNAHLQASRLRHSRQHYGSNWQYKGGNRRTSVDLDESELMRQMRNHLNEDLDDTIITADQSFEQDQLPEPPTWINYLGELGDYIYSQLRQYLERSSPAGSSSGKNKVTSDETNDPDNNDSSQYQQQQIQKQQQQLRIETIDELLDDYYYDQYENSQVLYYGSQLVREGDIFEIGCYLPSDQSAEWTKSGRPMAGKGGLDGGVSNSPRVIRRSDFLGAKQNFSLKVFEASLVSIVTLELYICI